MRTNLGILAIFERFLKKTDNGWKVTKSDIEVLINTLNEYAKDL